MTQMISLVRWAIRFRALPVLALAGTLTACDSTERLTSTSDSPGTFASDAVVPAETPSFASGFRGGIPFGTWALPTELFGPVYNGAMRNIWSKHLLRELAAIKARGGRVVLAFAGHERNFKDSEGHFSLKMWKDRIDLFRGVNFNSYLDDGTIIGQYMIDEPNDPVNWTGIPVEGPTLEAMATYSKSIWPKMATIVRATPTYMGKWPGIYRNLDAAWAQWWVMRGEPDEYIAREVAEAKKLGLTLIMGLNIRKGGVNKSHMPASIVRSAGAVLMAQEYPCAFISWEYDEPYLARDDVREAMLFLSKKAEEHPARSCSRGGSPPPPPQNEPPTADFDPPSCTVGVGCRFTDKSRDRDGTIESWSWDFGDGETSTQQNPTHTYARANTYSVTLRVTDDDGASRSASANVRVTSAGNEAPTAAFDPPSCTAGEDCRFHDESSDRDGEIERWSWDFGDGRTSTVQNPTHRYAAANTYTVTLRVTDDDGATNSVSASVTVRSRGNQPPTAAFTPPRCTATVPCQFNDESRDSDGSIVSRSWSFEDGATSSEANPLYTFATAGTRSVTLRVTDNGGATSSISRNVTVAPRTFPGGDRIVLNSGLVVQDGRQRIRLTWTGARGSSLDVYRNEVRREKVINDGLYIRSRGGLEAGTYTYRLCERETAKCSNQSSVTFR
jgi:PKD repeat protein